jgi:hypothetical protein
MSVIVSYFDQFPEWNGVRFEFRGDDGYVNVSTLNTALNKRFTDWRKTKFAQELLDELSTGYDIPIALGEFSQGNGKALIYRLPGGGREGWRTYVHPAVALSYCMSEPRLQARINMWIINMLTLGTTTPHYKDWSALEYLRGLDFNRDDIREMYR